MTPARATLKRRPELTERCEQEVANGTRKNRLRLQTKNVGGRTPSLRGGQGRLAPGKIPRWLQVDHARRATARRTGGARGRQAHRGAKVGKLVWIHQLWLPQCARQWPNLASKSGRAYKQRGKKGREIGHAATTPEPTET